LFTVSWSFSTQQPHHDDAWLQSVAVPVSLFCVVMPNWIGIQRLKLERAVLLFTEHITVRCTLFWGTESYFISGILYTTQNYASDEEIHTYWLVCNAMAFVPSSIMKTKCLWFCRERESSELWKILDLFSWKLDGIFISIYYIVHGMSAWAKQLYLYTLQIPRKHFSVRGKWKWWNHLKFGMLAFCNKIYGKSKYFAKDKEVSTKELLCDTSKKS